MLTKVVYKQLENDMSGIGVKISDTTKRLRGFNIQISNPTIWELNDPTSYLEWTIVLFSTGERKSCHHQ